MNEKPLINKPAPIPSRRIFSLVLLTMAVAVGHLWHADRQTRSELDSLRREMTALRAQTESEDTSLAAQRDELRRIGEDLIVLAARPALDDESQDLLTGLATQQSNLTVWAENMVAWLEQNLANQAGPASQVAETPEATRQRILAGISYLQRRLEDRQNELEEIETRLSALAEEHGVPPALQEATPAELEQLLSTQDLSAYEPYLEFRREADEQRRVARALTLRIAQERLELRVATFEPNASAP